MILRSRNVKGVKPTRLKLPKSTPLAIDNDFALYGMEELFQEGLDYIAKLTDGDIHLYLYG